MALSSIPIPPLGVLSVIKYHTYFGAFSLCYSSQKSLKVQLVTLRKIKSYAISVHILFALVWIGKGSLWCSSPVIFMLMFILYVSAHAHTDLSQRNENADDSLIKSRRLSLHLCRSDCFRSQRGLAYSQAGGSDAEWESSQFLALCGVGKYF